MSTHDKQRAQWPLIEDLNVFLTVVRKESFANAAAELGLSPSYVSKRIGLLEKSLGMRLFHRSARAIRLTADGHKALSGAISVLDSMGEFVAGLAAWRDAIEGNIHISCSFGFGSTYMAEALSALAERYPALNVKLTLTDRVVDLIEEGVDLEIHVGDDIKDLYITRRLSLNRRVLCAAPQYLAGHGTPAQISDLKQHKCLVIQERSAQFGVWPLTNGRDSTQLHIGSQLSSNSGSVVLSWALNGHGIILRSLWEVQRYLASGELVQILPPWHQSADIWAVYSNRTSGSAKLKVCIDFLMDYFQQNPPVSDALWGKITSEDGESRLV
ncbi:LysR family transcriptional regulator [Raoultella terrigena]|jgi:DNA-binding transcriptional LysR family regulator|uniref:D-malate degradation protein R n=1 Tax=Raoultella terrigena TaxID=577 RepID=A0A485CGQ3_RAOTE|nr:LysR substrate-binding domain-containing protein [Raoultella terrigena]GEC68772.1 LysR family transcriptional regulator [Raoultella terrigena]VFS83803.1 D-malate degradation protein R [Raoultella terrigena]